MAQTCAPAQPGAPTVGLSASPRLVSRQAQRLPGRGRSKIPAAKRRGIAELLGGVKAHCPRLPGEVSQHTRYRLVNPTKGPSPIGIVFPCTPTISTWKRPS